MNSFAQFMTVLLIFVIVLAITYFVTRFIGVYQKTQGRTGNIELIESARISPSVYVQIVRVGSKYVALSVGKDNSSFLCELSEDEIRTGTGTSASLSGGSFDSILNKLKGRISGEDSVSGLEDRQDEK